MQHQLNQIPLTMPIKRQPGLSATIELAQKARILKAQGRDIIELAGGDPDFTPDIHIQQAIIDSLKRGEAKYTHPRGIPELRNAIANKLKRENRINADANSEIIVTAGGKEAIAITLMALLEYGDDVLIPAPSWVSFDNMVIIAGGRPVLINAKASDSFKITPDHLESHYTKKTRAIIFNNPHNPTGQFYTESETRAIAEWCVNRNVYLIADEVYEHILFDNNSLFSAASVDKYKNHVITVNALSKSYAMTGLRIGYLHAASELIDKIDPIHQHLITCAPSIIQWGAKTALEGTNQFVLERKEIYSKRRDLVLQLLSDSNYVKPLKPTGTFYMFLDITKTKLSSTSFCAQLLDDGNLALCPGSAFSDAGEGWVRMLFARDNKTLEKACESILRVFG